MPKRGKAKRQSQGFSFMRQKRSFLPDMQFQWSYTINPDFARDMFFSEFVPAAVSAVSGAWRRMPGAARVCELPGRALTFFIPHSFLMKQ